MIQIHKWLETCQEFLLPHIIWEIIFFCIKFIYSFMNVPQDERWTSSSSHDSHLNCIRSFFFYHWISFFIFQIKWCSTHFDHWIIMYHIRTIQSYIHLHFHHTIYDYGINQEFNKKICKKWILYRTKKWLIIISWKIIFMERKNCNHKPQ
jgi:hypothetical protein